MFVMFVSFQLAIVLLGCEIEYIVLWRTNDDAKKGWRTLRNYMILFIMVFLILTPGVLEFLIGVDTLSDLFNPLFFAWYVIIGWFLGKVIARQTYILKPPSEIKGFLRGLKEDRNTS